MGNAFKLPDRRLFLLSGLSLAGLRTSTASTAEHVYRFVTDRCDVQLSVKFHDSYSSRGFWFGHRPEERFCLSIKGEKERYCPEGFVGSLAVARYEVRTHERRPRVSALREHVRNIDRDERLAARPPFDRTVELRQGVASDIQAFGYKESGPNPMAAEPSDSGTPWYYFRQDLYLDGDGAPFLIIHWKHALSAIRMLDIIPASGTSLVSK